MTEPEYIFRKGEGWVINTKPVFALKPGMIWRPSTHDYMQGGEICPRCEKTYNHHNWWDCPSRKYGRTVWGPAKWPCGPEDL